MDKGTLLRELPVYQGQNTVLVEKQDVNDIMRGLGYAHEYFKGDYDKIARYFDRPTVTETARALWNFCKKNIPYNIEPDKLQSVRSPAAILAMIDGGDCKNYAQFIGGVLDALNRQGKKIKWFYRFASYNLFDSTPEHVFVVVQDQGRELWIDPVLKNFNGRSPRPVYSVDKKVKDGTMALVMIKGIPQDRRSGLGAPASGGPSFKSTNTVKRVYPVTIAGPTACIASPDIPAMSRKRKKTTVGDTGTGVVPVLANAVPSIAKSIPVLSTIVTVGETVLNLALAVFGNNWKTSSGVRWLTQKYEFYVLGDASKTSDNKVNEADTPNAAKWFSLVLGVPLYDQYRLHALKGTDPTNGNPLNNSYQDRANDYLAYPEAQAAGVTNAQALQAAHLSDNLPWWPQTAGAWRGALPAPNVVAAPGMPTGPGAIDPATGLPVNNPPTGNTLTSFFSGNPLLILGLVGAGAFMLFKKR